MSFRGQVAERTLRRLFPNPFRADEVGQEITLLPSLWRKYHADWNKRFADRNVPLFQTLFGDALVYAGLGVMERREMTPAEHEEAERRLGYFKQSFAPDGAIVEQHYGIETIGLDVTFDPAVALFFASHRFEPRADGTATFVPGPTGVVYALVSQSD